MLVIDEPKPANCPTCDYKSEHVHNYMHHLGKPWLMIPLNILELDHLIRKLIVGEVE